MKKHIIAVAVAAAFAAPVAMADTTLYGLANMSLDYIDAGQFNEGKKVVGTTTSYSPRGGTNFNVASGSSRIGVKGSEAITKDLSAIYQAEFGVDMADGSTALTNRNQYAGLSSKSFGTFIAGRHDTPMKLAISKYDLFGDQIGDNGNIAGQAPTSAGFNLRTPNTVAYMTPNFAGFSAILAYVADHEQALSSAPNDDRNKNDAFSASATYDYKKMFNVTAAYELHNAKFIQDLGRGKEDAWMIGGGANIAGFTVNALYQQIKDFATANNKTDIWGLGAAYTFGKKHTVKGQYYNSDSQAYADKRNMFAVGYDFAISKQTTLFAAYAYGDNGQATWADGHGGKTAVGIENNGDYSNTNAFSVGMKYKF
ncbi:MAG: porin [Halothiobacillaceae bacterium]|nr:porin [Halothiobacillaceae bacterium]